MFIRSNPSCARRAQRAFTLIEMMIVVAIIGILSAIAYPSYVKQVQRGKRSDAQTVLMEASQFMQRYYIARNSFTGMDSAALEAAGLGVSPKGATTAAYNITVTLSDADRAYELKATPVASDDDCGFITLTDTGAKGSQSGTVADCWK